MKTEEQKSKRNIEYRKKRYAVDLEFRKRMQEYRRNRYANNLKIRKQKSKYHKKWISNPENKERHRLRIKTRYTSDLKFREKHAANVAKRKRELGWNSLNSSFLGCCGHHIDKTNVINIPKELHIIYQHKQSNNEQMKQINLIAWDFMEGDVL